MNAWTEFIPNQSFALLLVATYVYTYVHMYILLTALFPWMNNISWYSLVIWSIVSSSCISQDPPLSSNLSSVLHWPVHQWSLESSHLIVMCNVYISIAGKHIYVCYWKLMNGCTYVSSSKDSLNWIRVTPVDLFDPLTHITIRMWPTYDPLVTLMLKFYF